MVGGKFWVFTSFLLQWVIAKVIGVVASVTCVNTKEEIYMDKINWQWQKVYDNDLFIWVVEGENQHNISYFQFQLITVSGSIIMYRFYLVKIQQK